MTTLLATWACCPGYTIIAVSLSRKNTASLAALIIHHEDGKGDCMGSLFYISLGSQDQLRSSLAGLACLRKGGSSVKCQ